MFSTYESKSFDPFYIYLLRQLFNCDYYNIFTYTFLLFSQLLWLQNASVFVANDLFRKCLHIIGIYWELF